MRLKSYTILKAGSPDWLAASVNSYLELGWQAVGGVAVTNLGIHAQAIAWNTSVADSNYVGQDPIYPNAVETEPKKPSKKKASKETPKNA